MIEHEIAKRCRVLLTAPAVQKTLKQLQAWDENTLQEQIEICEITAAPFHEQQRADFFLGKLQQIGLQEIHKDSAGNVLGSSACGNDGKLLIAAHLDTVFAQGTDTRVKRAEGRLHAPGLVDDSRGLAEVLAVARALQYSGIKTWRKVVFCGDVGEEGTGNLRGVRHIFQHTKGISGFVSLDGFMDPAAITYLGMGSKRYEATYTGPGGHSLYNFGRPSAVHAAGRAIAKIAELPSLPGTTFTVGTVKGGSAVNAIAAKAGMQIDLRGENPQNLSKLEQAVQKCLKSAAQDENSRWKSKSIQLKVEEIGSRPCGVQPADADIVVAAACATKAVGLTPRLEPPSSTDSNIPICLGIPAVTLDCGGKAGGTHSFSEWFLPRQSFLGPQRAFLLVLLLSGAEGIIPPLL